MNIYWCFDPGVSLANCPSNAIVHGCPDSIVASASCIMPPAIQTPHTGIDFPFIGFGLVIAGVLILGKKWGG